MMLRRLLPLLLALPLLAVHAAEPPFPRGKLPGNVIPKRYELTLELDPRQPEFAGQVAITVDVREPLRQIWLHSLGLKASKAVIETGGRSVPATLDEVDTVSGVARFSVDAPLPTGAAVIRVTYTGSYREGAEGLFRSHVGDDWYVFSQMEAIDARRVFPGFDEPRFKTPFAITIVAPKSDAAISNAPVASVTNLSDGRVRHVFTPTLPLPTYLVAVAVGPLDIVTPPPIPANDVRMAPLPLRGIATRGQGPKLAFAMRETPELVKRLEQYFGIAYPYPKLDLIASPDMGGAMENAGAILFSDDLLLLAPDAPVRQIRNFGNVNAHEIAHHWFGDLVTPFWWDDIWLNESFAEWAGLKISDAWRPDLSLRATLISDAFGTMDLDSRRAGRPIREVIDDNTRISSTFDDITYQKGGGVLAMFESYMGEVVFRRGVRLHMAAHTHGNATARDFFSALAKAADQPALVDAFRTFVEQPGVPIVTVRVATDRRRLELAQARYRPIGSTLAPGGAWKIPFCASLLGDGESRKVCTLITGPSAVLELPADAKFTAVMPNADGAGYYRFALDATGLDALLARAATLPTGEGIALADSIQSGFGAGTLDADKLLAAAKALAPHPHHSVATMLGDTLAELHDRVAEPTQRAQLERQIVAIYGPRLKLLGYNTHVGTYRKDPPEQQLLRTALLHLVALTGRDRGVCAALTLAARQSLEDPKALDTSLRAVAWSVAVREDPAFGDALAKRMLASDDALLRNDASAALGATEQPQQAAKALALALSDDARVGEMIGIVRGQISSPVTRESTWKWLQANFEPVMRKVPGFAQAGAFNVPGPFCDAPHRGEVEQFFTPQTKRLGRGELELARTLEGIDLCVAMKAHHAQGLASALTR